MICIKGNNKEGHVSNKNTEFANNGFQRKKIISSIDRSDDGIKLGVETMKKTIDEIIIIDGHPKARELETWLCECDPPSRKTAWFFKYLFGESMDCLYGVNVYLSLSMLMYGIMLLL